MLCYPFVYFLNILSFDKKNSIIIITNSFVIILLYKLFDLSQLLFEFGDFHGRRTYHKNKKYTCWILYDTYLYHTS